MPAEVVGTDPGDGISGLGTTLVGATTGPIGMILGLNIDGIEIGELDVTTMNALSAPNFGWRKIISNKLKDAKTITLDLLYEKGNMAILLGHVGLVNENWTVAFPDGSTYVQAGHISKLGVQSKHDDKIMQPVTLRMSGPPTYSAASGS